ncbi:hypothetical protein NQ314_004167 [Rhamnusium bicolor]|uniref:dolichol kinase n=1 Tax=Rhamnusium bicolor TaxID=1586634 RepID=A0AAV8ZMW4_9CUCU|nr:hypothetical protein NQ314_004167 [Rhamnusium bicolor]
MPSETPGFLIINDFKTRPNAADGVWVLYLLPLSLIISTIKHPIIATPTYKLASLLSTGLLLTSAVIAVQKSKNQRLKIINTWTILVLLLTSVLFHVCFHKDWLFCVLSGVASTLIYFKIYIFVLSKFEECFTLGEAGLISQGVVIVIYIATINVMNSSQGSYKSNVQISTLIIQVGLLGIGTIAVMAYNFKIKSAKAFYITTFAVITLVILLPLHMLLNRSPVLWILNLIFSDLTLILRILYIPPLGPQLQDGFAVFSDEKDRGILALTPIYLLAGCSLPLWIHPSPCDVTDSAMFNLSPLLSGLLSVGLGDTAASIVGSNYGKHFWPDYLENVTFEQYRKLYFSVFVGSLVEARTTQVDNLVLPLIMYIMLI